MFSVIHYISANKRLKEFEKTVRMLGGESECPPMILAQRDMCRFEKEYYHEEVITWCIRSLFVITIFLLVGILYKMYEAFHVK